MTQQTKEMTTIQNSMLWDVLAGSVPVYSQDLQDPYVQLSVKLVEEEVNGEGELLDSYNKGNLEGVLDGLGDTLKVVSQLCFALAVDPENILTEVNRSNFSKFCATEEEAEESVESYRNSLRYKGVHYVQNAGLYIIKGWYIEQDEEVDAPKVLKGIKFFEPNMKQFIHALNNNNNEENV